MSNFAHPIPPPLALNRRPVDSFRVTNPPKLYLEQTERRYLRLLRFGGFEPASSGSHWRFGTRFISAAVVARLLTKNLVIDCGGRILLAERSA